MRAQVEPGYGIPTEPDAGLHVPGWGDILIEAKFGSGMSRRKNQRALEAFAVHYAKAAPCLLDPAKIVAVGNRRVPEQLLRNLTYACKLAERSGLRAHVVALVREGEAEDIEERVAACLVNPSDPFVTFSRATWESIYAGLDQSNPDVGGLVTFFQQKSLYLSPAFAIAP